MDGKVNLAEKLSRFSDRFAPRTVAEFNGHDVMVTKLEGEFIWHNHEETDDFFLVLEGRLVIHMRDRDDVVLGPGELYVVARCRAQTGRAGGNARAANRANRHTEHGRRGNSGPSPGTLAAGLPPT